MEEVMDANLEEMRDFFGDDAERYGLVDVGGELSVERLLHAYQHGVFPWYDDPLPVCWWSPDPRAIFELGAHDGLHVSRRLRRTLAQARYEVTVDRDFESVIAGCADRPGEGTWITAAMQAAYIELHEAGHAHSVEVWQAGSLIGGIYGVAIGGFFAGESMFHRARDASKIALVHLVARLRERGFQLFDTQMLTDQTERMGAVEIPRDEYMDRLRRALRANVSFAD
jgi:leucyl/phenylalanyl-tRNA--protein transferase